MKTKRFLLTVLLLSILFVQILPAQTISSEIEKQRSFIDIFKSLASNETRTPQEKVYLHLDNNSYLMDETIWFKAYVVRASSLAPTTLSQVLYVELLNSDGEIIQRKTLRVVKGQAYGEFDLSSLFLIHGGFYEIRAYTRAMLNWGGEVAFSRVVPVFEKSEKSSPGDFSNLYLYEAVPSKKTVAYRADAAPLRDNSTQEKKDLMVTFYPEGGERVEGLSSRVAFKVTDDKGVGQEAECRVLSSDGKQLASASVLHDGMGLLDVPASAVYAEIIKGQSTPIRFDLPKPQSDGCVMRVNMDKDSVSVLLKRSSAFSSETLGVSISCRGKACFFDTIKVDEKRLSVSMDALHDGVNQVTVFSASGRILAERLVWKVPYLSSTNLFVQQNSSSYKPFSPVILKLSLSDASKKATGGVFSLSVRDANGVLTGSESSIQQNLLLTSDIRGYIASPEYYFKSSDDQSLQALDLLLMVQGWRRYEWKEMAEVKPFVMKQPIEEGQFIDGIVSEKKSNLRPLSGVKVDLSIFLPGMSVQGSCVTDSVGHFAMLPPTYFGEGIGNFVTTMNGNRKNAKIVLNRAFRPKVRIYEPAELNANRNKGYKYIAVSEPNVFEWVDTFKGKVYPLPEAKVSGKKKDDYYSGRFTWGGGEDYGKRNANLYYNVMDEIETITDKGEEIPIVWDWLMKRNSHFEYDYGDYSSLKYKGRTAKVFLNNDKIVGSYDIFLDELKSVIINEERRESDTTFIMLYSSSSSAAKQKKGERMVRFHGYSVPAEFYSPDYRKTDVPTVADFDRTIFWAPNVVTDASGKATVSFYSNARSDLQLRISAQGLSFKGGLIDYSR